MNQSKVYFPGLNGIRFFAAFLVLIDHLELFKGYFGFKTLWSQEFSAHLGSLGVTIFFVLSGFLITYLLLIEKVTSHINIKNFYIRRVLRIWPLYYLIVLLSFFIIPKINFFDVPVYTEAIGSVIGLKLFLFNFFLANVAFVFLPTVAFANILWSVAVEEQFYLMWPIIIKYFKNTRTILIMVFVIYFCFKIFFALNLLGLNKYWASSINSLINRTRISCMVIGAAGAFALIKNEYIVHKYLFNKYIQILAILFFVIVLFDILRFPFSYFINSELFALIIIVLLLNISSNKNTILRLENSYLNFLGKISYGIYLYHLFCALIGIKLFIYFKLTTTLPYYLWSVLLIVFVCFTTVCIANISYNYFEKPFLKIKTKYQ